MTVVRYDHTPIYHCLQILFLFRSMLLVHCTDWKLAKNSRLRSTVIGKCVLLRPAQVPTEPERAQGRLVQVPGCGWNPSGNVIPRGVRTWSGNPEGGLWYVLRGLDERAASEDPRGDRDQGLLLRVGVRNVSVRIQEFGSNVSGSVGGPEWHLLRLLPQDPARHPVQFWLLCWSLSTSIAMENFSSRRWTTVLAPW